MANVQSSVAPSSSGYWTEGKVVNGTNVGGGVFVPGTSSGSGGSSGGGSSVLNSGGYNTLFGNTPSGNVTKTNAPGIVPQVYPGSTGSGSNQNSSSSNYGGYTPQPLTPYTPNYGGSQSSGLLGSILGSFSGGGGGTASALDAYNSSTGNGGWTGSAGTTQAPTYASNQLNGGAGGTTQNSYNAQLNTQNQGSNAPINALTGQWNNTANTDPNNQTNNNNNNQNDNQGYGQNPNQGQGLYQQYLNQYQNYANTPDNAITKAQSDLQNTINSSASEQASVQGDPNLSLDTQQGQAGVIQNRFASKLPAYQTALQVAQTNRQQQLDAYGNLVTAAAPHWNGYVGQSPLNGQVINNGGQGGVNGAIQLGAGYDAQATQAQNYQAGLKNLRAADGLQGGIENTLAQNPQLNNTPISAITNLRQWLAGQTSDPAQQILAQQVSAYVQALGYTPDQAAAIASQRGGTIGSLLNNLRSQYETQNNANYGSNSSTSGSSGGNTYQGYTLPN